MSLTKIQQKKAANPGGFAFKEFSVLPETLKVDSRRISGIAATFGNIDLDRDRLHKGCFAQSIVQRGPESSAKAKIVLLWQHKRDEPIGKIVVLEERSMGLYFEADLDEGVQRAEQALTQLESGTINSFSIGFQYDWDNIEYNWEENAYEVFSVKLFEISPVSIPADENTFYMGLKSAEDFERAELELSEQIKESIKNLDINQQRELLELFLLQKSLSRALSASETKERIKQDTIERTEAEKTKPLFAGIVFNN